MEWRSFYNFRNTESSFKFRQRELNTYIICGPVAATVGLFNDMQQYMNIVPYQYCILWQPVPDTVAMEAQGAGDTGGLPPFSPRPHWRGPTQSKGETPAMEEGDQTQMSGMKREAETV